MREMGGEDQKHMWVRVGHGVLGGNVVLRAHIHNEKENTQVWTCSLVSA